MLAFALSIAWNCKVVAVDPEVHFFFCCCSCSMKLSACTSCFICRVELGQVKDQFSVSWFPPCLECVVVSISSFSLHCACSFVMWRVCKGQHFPSLVHLTTGLFVTYFYNEFPPMISLVVVCHLLL